MREALRFVPNGALFQGNGVKKEEQPKNEPGREGGGRGNGRGLARCQSFGWAGQKAPWEGIAPIAVGVASAVGVAWKRCASTRWAWPRSKVGVTNRRCGRGHARCGRGHQSVGVAVGGAKVLIGVRWAGLEGGSSPLAPHGISGGSIGGSLEWGGGTPKVGGCPPYCCHQALEALPCARGGLHVAVLRLFGSSQ